MCIIIRKIKGLFYLFLKLISFIISKCKIWSDNIEISMLWNINRILGCIMYREICRYWVYIIIYISEKKWFYVMKISYVKIYIYINMVNLY